MYIDIKYLLELPYHWDPDKNLWLKENRGISFEEAVEEITAGRVYDIKNDISPINHKSQESLVIMLNGYIHYVPFIRNWNHLFLKTVIPSRELHKIYGRRNTL